MEDRRSRIRGRLVRLVGVDPDDENYAIYVHYRGKTSTRHPDAYASVPHPNRADTMCDYIRVLRVIRS